MRGRPRGSIKIENPSFYTTYIPSLHGGVDRDDYCTWCKLIAAQDPQEVEILSRVTPHNSHAYKVWVLLPISGTGIWRASCWRWDNASFDKWPGASKQFAGRRHEHRTVGGDTSLNYEGNLSGFITHLQTHKLWTHPALEEVLTRHYKYKPAADRVLPDFAHEPHYFGSN